MSEDADRGVEVPPHPYSKPFKKEEKELKRGNPLEGIFILIGKLFPSSIKKKINKMLKTAGKDSIPEQWLGGAILLAFFYSLVFTLVPLFLLKLSTLQYLVFGVITFSFIFSLYWFALYHAMLKAQKTDKLEPKKMLFLNRRIFIRFYHSVSRIYPWNFREHIRQLILFSGDRYASPEQWLGVASILSLLYSLVAGIAAYFIFFPQLIYPLITFILFFVISFFVQYMLAYYKAENRRKEVETVLPDFLQLISANIRAGMTPFAALRSSARKEFGPLKDEVEYATVRSLGTQSFTDSLEEISLTIKSEVLERVITLFASGLRSGGKLSSLLENAAQDISQSQELNTQLVSSTRMYMMFILFNIAIGSPLMLAISMQFVDMVNSFEQAGSGEQVIEGLGGGMAESSMMSTDFLFKASLIIITVTCFIASGFMGVINEGSVRNGFKYFLPLAGFAILAFLVFRIFVGNIVSGMV